MFKRVKVVMLPTKQSISPITRGVDIFSEVPGGYGQTNFHLYFLSEDKILPGDYFTSIKSPDWGEASQDYGLFKCADKIHSISINHQAEERGWRKIIATTNWQLSADPSTPGYTGIPRPSPTFVKKYINLYDQEDKRILEVDVEDNDVLITESTESHNDNDILVNGEKVFTWSYEEPEVLEAEIEKHRKPKVNTKFNTITIKKLKDTFTLEDVKHMAWLAWSKEYSPLAGRITKEFEDWWERKKDTLYL